eukprot:470506_1
MEVVVDKQQKTIQKLLHEIKEINNKSKHNKKTIIEKDNEINSKDNEELQQYRLNIEKKEKEWKMKYAKERETLDAERLRIDGLQRLRMEEAQLLRKQQQQILEQEKKKKEEEWKEKETEWLKKQQDYEEKLEMEEA